MSEIVVAAVVVVVGPAAEPVVPGTIFLSIQLSTFTYITSLGVILRDLFPNQRSLYT